MRIVILDGYTLGVKDIDLSPLEALGEVAFYDRSSPDQVVERARGAEIVLTNKVAIDADQIAALPELRYIGVLATGFNMVDAEAARARGIDVTNIPAYSTASVTQLTFALILELAHGVGHHSGAVREGRWSAQPDFSFWDFPLLELHGQSLGIIGYGEIGRSVAKVANAFGMQVATLDRGKPIDFPVQRMPLPDLLASSTFVSLHCPLNSGTKGMVNREFIDQMGRHSYLINTARGGLIDEPVLAEALNTGRIAGAGLDVLTLEPPSADHPLVSATNCVVTPHVGWATVAARRRLVSIAVANLASFLQGSPQNVVNA